jgi:hypothetical protein
MRVAFDTERLHVPPAVRAGIVIGSAIALAGIGVGGIRGSTSNQVPLVYVANPSSSPVPVSVTNQGSAQTVTGTVNVGNFPSTQPVSGTVSVSNFPSSETAKVAPATKAINTGTLSLDSGGGNGAKVFGETIYVTEVALANTNLIDAYSDTIALSLLTPAGAFVTIHVGDGSALITLPVPVPATQLNYACLNSIESCDFSATVVGY